MVTWEMGRIDGLFQVLVFLRKLVLEQNIV